MNKRIFLKNTAVMTGTSLLLRTLGIVFRIFISNRVGAEGMGLYQLVFSVYVLGTTFGSAGLSTAVTRMTAIRLARNDSAGVRRVMRLAIALSVAVGTVSAAALYMFAAPLGRLVGDVRATSAIAISGLALPFIGVSGCLKGYFMARRRATPAGLSQIVEQLVRIGSILLLLRMAGENCSLEDSCRIIIAGDALSEATAFVFLSVAYRMDKRALPTRGLIGADASTRALVRPLLHIAVPLTAGRYLSTGLRTVENVLVPSRLTRFTADRALALEQFGAIKGMALPLLFFPAAFLVTVSGLLVPELSDAHALGQRRQVSLLTCRAMQITLPCAIWIGCLFTVLGRPLGRVLYGDDTVGLLLQILGPLTPIMYLDSVATGMLKGLGEQVRSLWYGVADSVVRIVLIWILLPYYGITGFLFVMLTSNLLTSFLSTHRLLTVSHTSMQWRRWVLCPVLVALLAGGGWVALVDVWKPTESPWTLLLGVGCVSAVYGLLLPLFGAFPVSGTRMRQTVNKVAAK